MASIGLGLTSDGWLCGGQRVLGNGQRLASGETARAQGAQGDRGHAKQRAERRQNGYRTTNKLRALAFLASLRSDRSVFIRGERGVVMDGSNKPVLPTAPTPRNEYSPSSLRRQTGQPFDAWQ